MAYPTNWSKKQLLELYELREQGLSYNEISDMTNRSVGSISSKYRRMDWDRFLGDPDEYFEDVTDFRFWTRDEMLQLDAFLKAGKSYAFIADQLDRGIISVERKAQTTDWKAWYELSTAEESASEGPDKKDKVLDNCSNSLLNAVRSEFSRLKDINEKQFLKLVNGEPESLPLPFEEIKQKAIDKLITQGQGNPESLSLDHGTYIIVGDSHGKHTKKGMFKLLQQVNKVLKPKNIIHIGHIVDDDNDISYDWGQFDNLIVLAKSNELRAVQEQRNKFNFSYDIVRESINIGDLIVFSQDLIEDYVRTPISNLDTQIFDEKVIVNCHRLEFTTRCYNETSSYFASPGCLCENHIVRTVKQQDFTDGRVVKQAYWEGFSKYRRMKHTNKYWERGMIVVQMDENGNHTIVPCSIKRTCKGFTTSYFDKMISEKGVFNPTKKIFINGDMHCDKHDCDVLDIQERICKDYKPDITVNVGDTMNYSSLNHHVMDRGGVILDKKILDESAETHSILKRTSKWAKENHLICGNHERFARDFVEKYPQFGKYLDFRFLCGLDDLNYKLTDIKNVVKIGSAKFIHGEIRMYGAPGSKLEKAARTFGRDVFIGHIHCPAIRFGCYSVGLTGQLDQDYNEPNSSKWLHGFGLCNQFKGKSWPTTIAIVENKCVLGGKTYSPKNTDSWKLNKYDAKLVYDIR